MAYRAGVLGKKVVKPAPAKPVVKPAVPAKQAVAPKRAVAKPPAVKLVPKPAVPAKQAVTLVPLKGVTPALARAAVLARPVTARVAPAATPHAAATRAAAAAQVKKGVVGAEAKLAKAEKVVETLTVAKKQAEVARKVEAARPEEFTKPALVNVIPAKKYEVTGTIGAAVIVNLEDKIRGALVEKLKEKKLTLESINFFDFKRPDPFSHQLSFKAIVVGSPIAPAIIVAVILAVKISLVILAIWVVGEFVIKPIFVGAPSPPPPAPPPAGAPPEVWDKYYSAYETMPEAPTAPIAQLTAGLGNLVPLILLGGGAYLLLKAKPWEKKPKEEKKEVSPL